MNRSILRYNCKHTSCFVQLLQDEAREFVASHEEYFQLLGLLRVGGITTRCLVIGCEFQGAYSTRVRPWGDTEQHHVWREVSVESSVHRRSLSLTSAFPGGGVSTPNLNPKLTLALVVGGGSLLRAITFLLLDHNEMQPQPSSSRLKSCSHSLLSIACSRR